MMQSGCAAQVTPAFRVLSPSQLDQIHDASLEILRRTGVRIYSDEAIDLLRAAGAFVEDGSLVKIPSRLVDWAVRAAPRNTPSFPAPARWQCSWVGAGPTSARAPIP